MAKRAKIIIAYIVNLRPVFLYAVIERANNKRENIPIARATAFSNPSNGSISRITENKIVNNVNIGSSSIPFP